MSARARLQGWLREPLLHFLAIGLALFVGYGALNPQQEEDRSDRIVITEDDLRQIEIAWIAQTRRRPTREEMLRLVEQKVREEILYSEALALGLDKDDSIVKRRLAQKMEFLAEDIASVRDPTSAELRAWFDLNRVRFALPARASFHHLYFSPDSRGEQARGDAAAALTMLAGGPADASGAAEIGDPFMAQDYYSGRTPEQVASVFGADFARSVFEQAAGAWLGPIESGLGWHLVFVGAIMPSRLPLFEEVEPAVKSEWMDAERAESKRKMFEAMRARYQVVLPASRTGESAGAAAPLAAANR